jgi:inosose dehydratase
LCHCPSLGGPHTRIPDLSRQRVRREHFGTEQRVLGSIRWIARIQADSDRLASNGLHQIAKLTGEQINSAVILNRDPDALVSRIGLYSPKHADAFVDVLVDRWRAQPLGYSAEQTSHHQRAARHRYIDHFDQLLFARTETGVEHGRESIEAPHAHLDRQMELLGPRSQIVQIPELQRVQEPALGELHVVNAQTSRVLERLDGAPSLPVQAEGIDSESCSHDGLSEAWRTWIVCQVYNRSAITGRAERPSDRRGAHEMLAVGCSTITWRPTGHEASMEDMLRDIAEVGYAGVPAGLREGERPEKVAELYGSFGLRPLAGYLGARYHDPAERAQILEQVRRHIEWSLALGVTELLVAESCFAERFAVAGHETANRSDQLSDAGYDYVADVLNEAGRLCREQGVRACFHNHAGSYIETRDEFDRLLALTDPELVFIGLDTGHLAYGGGDVPDFVASYAPRIKILHLKDVYPNVLEQARRHKWDYHTAQAHGLWAELGEGVVDFRAVFEHLSRVGYEGWAIVEIDRTTKPTPRDSIAACYGHLAGLGLVSATT